MAVLSAIVCVSSEAAGLNLMVRFFKCLVVFLLVKLLSSGSVHSQEFGNIITMGDSLTAGLSRVAGRGIICRAQGNRVVAVTDQRSCRGNGMEGVGGWQPRLKLLTGGSIYNYGNTGEVTAEMVARFNSVLSQRDSDYVLILAGTNDMIFGRSLSGAVDNIATMIQRTINAGRTPIVATAPPLLGGRFSSSNARILQLNQEIRLLPQRFDGLVVAEIYNQVVSGWPNTYSADSIHFNPAGDLLAADIWFDALQRSQPAPAGFFAPIINLLLDDD